MLPAAVSGSSNQQDPLQHEQDILRQEQTMSVSDLSDLTKNVVEEVV
jgi:hypothetical protein